MKRILGGLLCDYLEWWRTIKSGVSISGHAYVETQRDLHSQTLECSRCGDCSIGYYGTREET